MAAESGMDEMRREFEEVKIREIPAQWERFVWVKNLEDRLVVDGSYDSGVRLLYGTATHCYISGYFIASVAMTAAAAERWLRWLTGEGDRTSFDKLINIARSTDEISSTVDGRLHRLRKSMRAPVVHGKDEVLFVLGWERTGPGTWVAPEGYAGLGPEEAAREALETFLLLARETIPGGPGKSPPKGSASR